MIEGIYLLKDYITEQEEKAILSKIDRFPKMPYKNRNSVLRYGADVDYTPKIKSMPMPEWLSALCISINKDKLVSDVPNHVTINEYFPPQRIDYHIDGENGGPIITILSLLGDTTMLLRKKDNKNIQKIIIDVPRRSILQLSGEARWLWEHATEPAEEERISIVFRNVENGSKGSI